MYKLTLTQILDDPHTRVQERDLGSIIITDDDTATGKNPVSNYVAMFVRSSLEIKFRVKGHVRSQGPWILVRNVLEKYPSDVLEQLGR